MHQPFPEPLTNAPFVQPRSAPAPTRRAFEYLFPFRMRCRKLQAQHQSREVPWSTDLVPSLEAARLQLNCPLISPSVPDCIITFAAHALANSWWDPSSLPSWLSEDCYVQKIQPLLRTIKVREISEAMHVSKPYAALVRTDLPIGPSAASPNSRLVAYPEVELLGAPV